MEEENPAEEQAENQDTPIEAGLNPLALAIPLLALLITALGGIVFYLLRSTYLRTEARTALISEQQELSQSAFARAVREGTPERVQHYLNAGLDPRGKVSPSEDILRIAIARGHLQILEMVLNRSIPLEEERVRNLPTTSTVADAVGEDCLSLSAHPLNYAAAKSRPAVVELVRKYASVSLNGEKNSLSPLSCAAATNNTTIVEWLLDHGADPNRLERAQHTALSVAVAQQQLGALQLLLSRGGDPRTPLRSGENAIFEAAKNGNEAILSLLLQRPIDLNRENFRGEKPWQVAEAAGRFELVPLLHPEYLLYAGLAKQNPKVVNFALERGARVNVSDRDGVTPLLVALSEGSPARVRYLLQSETGLSFAASGSSQPVRTNNASLAQQFENVRRLIRKLEQTGGSLPPQAQEDSLYSELSAPPILLEEIDRGNAPAIPGTVLPALREDTAPLPKLLLLAGADPNAEDSSGNTPLHYALQRGDIEIVRELVVAGANYEKANRQGLSPLLHAIRLKRPDLALLFLNHHEPKDRDKNLERALLAAIETGQNGVALRLLQLGVSPEVKDKAHRSLIVIALANGNYELAEILKKFGATLDLTEKNVQSLYLYARREKESRLKQFLDAHSSGRDLISPEALEKSIERHTIERDRRS